MQQVSTTKGHLRDKILKDIQIGYIPRTFYDETFSMGMVYL